MIRFNRFSMPLAIAAVIAIPVLTNGCSDNPAAALCCTDFKVGADMSGVDFGVNASIKGQFEVFAQASGDFSAVASGMLTDVTNACKGMAMDLGATGNEADGLSDRDAMSKWCSLAATAVAEAKAEGNLTVEVVGGGCEASVKASADCQAKCDVKAECTGEAAVPKCTGGQVSLACDASCKAEAGASIDCKGSCDVAVSGSCTAQGGVDCQGKCEGTCEAGATADKNGAQADGTCKGTCKGKCSVVAPSAKCEGSFEGKCSGECKATATAKVECSGGCTGKAEPVKCTGGKLEVKCDATADCSANCSASVSAKAECHPPTVTVKAAGTASVKVAAAIDTISANLPALLVAVQGRAEGFVSAGEGLLSAGGNIVANAGDLNVKGAACAAQMVSVVTEAAANGSESLKAAASVSGKLVATN